MKIGKWILVAVCLGLLASFAAPAAAQDDARPYGSRDGWYCPWCQRGYGGMMGPGMMGPGMMGPGMMGPGMMGRGMMGPGYAPGWMHRGYPGAGQYQEVPLNKAEAKILVERYIRSTGNPNIRFGEITEEKDEYFVATVVTKGGDLVDKIMIDRYSGWFKSVY
ncbi:MAG: hypothetical protein JRI97_04995 [Deltaproteobacteria bacterium]|nr:hypothetical protein [Deltaproteobacteria bacterium]